MHATPKFGIVEFRIGRLWIFGNFGKICTNPATVLGGLSLPRALRSFEAAFAPWWSIGGVYSFPVAECP